MRAPKITILIKLLLLLVVMLSIPIVGFQYLRETERYLQSSLEDSLLAVGGALAVSLQNQSALFRTSAEGPSAVEPIFSHSLSYPIHLDGYIDDWTGYLEWADRFGGRASADLRDRRAPRFDLVIGEHEQYLNLILVVDDDSYVYQSAATYAPELADTVELVIFGIDAQPRSLFLGTATPGPVTAYDIRENWDFSTTRNPVTNVTGHWRESTNGYVVEIRVPLSIIGNAIGVRVHDTDQSFSGSLVASSMGEGKGARPNPLLRTSAKLQKTIQQIGLKTGRRIWVLNRTGQVLASSGSLVSESKRGAINFLYTWILPMAGGAFEDELRTASRLRGAEVLQALNGRAASRWRSSPDERAVIVSAAHPVRSGNELVGAIVVEETTNSIQTVQREATATLFNRSIMVFVGATFILLIFATRLSYRIMKLRDESERAINSHGRVVGGISTSTASDEIGDLARSYSALLSRLSDYNAYLESMASKLTHELRTPLTVVSSSLQNLDATRLNDDQEKYLSRGREGIERLHNLVSRLSEASRLEHSVSNVEFSKFDLAVLLSGCIDGYRNAYEGRHLELRLPEDTCLFRGSDDLIVQMLDKLIDNAMAFGAVEQPVVVALSLESPNYVIEVINRGPLLPDSMTQQIFNSLVSVREENHSGGTHLGLGLYIVRLIAEIHDGAVTAENLNNRSGVVFRVVMPENSLL